MDEWDGISDYSRVVMCICREGAETELVSSEVSPETNEIIGNGQGIRERA